MLCGKDVGPTTYLLVASSVSILEGRDKHEAIIWDVGASRVIRAKRSRFETTSFSPPHLKSKTSQQSKQHNTTPYLQYTL